MLCHKLARIGGSFLLGRPFRYVGVEGRGAGIGLAAARCPQRPGNTSAEARLAACTAVIRFRTWPATMASLLRTTAAVWCG